MAACFGPLSLSGDAAPLLRHRLTVLLIAGATYGAAMGTFGGITPARLIQMTYSAAKVPLLLGATFYADPALLDSYSAERVRHGGCGLVIVALVAHESGRTRQPSPHPTENIASFRVMADAIHSAGGKLFGQIFYWWGGAGQWQPLSPPAPSMGPSTARPSSAVK